MKKSQNKKKNQYLFLGVFIVIVVFALTLAGNYYKGKKGFIINGNRIDMSTRVDANTLFIDIDKEIVKSIAYKGTVEIKVMPEVPKGFDLEHGYVVSEWNYKFEFSNAKKERFTMQCTYGRGVSYIVQFQVGTEHASRKVFHATF